VASFSFPTNIFNARLGRSSTTLHVKHHIKPHWLASAFALFIVTNLEGPAPTKVTMGFTIYASAISFALYVSIFEKTLLLECIFWQSLRGSF
jgi:hypothetical protein